MDVDVVEVEVDGVPIANESTTSPILQVMSFFPALAGPQINSPCIPVDVKASFNAP